MLLLVIFTAIYYNKWRLTKADIHNLRARFSVAYSVFILVDEVCCDKQIEKRIWNIHFDRAAFSEADMCGRAEKLMINILPPEISMDGKMKRKKTNTRNRK